MNVLFYAKRTRRIKIFDILSLAKKEKTFEFAALLGHKNVHLGFDLEIQRGFI
jgi:hypothetical protein